MTAAIVAGLDERSLILTLQEVTEDLGGASPALDADEAHVLVAALLRAGGHGGTEATDLTGADQYAAARRVLTTLAEDPATAGAAGTVLADPPSDTRLAAELGVPAVAVLAGLIAWLQTKVDIRVTRKDGRTEFDFRVAKQAAPAGQLKDLAAAVLRMWNGDSRQ